MKPTILGIAAAVLLAGALAARGAGDPRAASWDEQNRAMGYLVMHLSSVNAINGINLNREQAVALRDLAREIEGIAPPPPNLQAPYRPDLDEVRDTYLEVRRLLLAGQEVGDALHEKIGRARHTQALVARASLAPTSAATEGCARCHAEPQAPDVRRLAASQATEEQPVATPWPQKQVFLEHQFGLFGRLGVFKLVTLAPQVDRILTPEQREGLRNFTCCLVPPKDLSNPVRIGQADGGDKAVDILRQVREVAPHQWPGVKQRALDRLDSLIVLLQPGATEDRKAEARRLVGDVYEEARQRSPVDFELDKEALAARLTRATRTSKDLDDRQQAYMRATFLLLPGAAEVYENLLRRLEAEAAQAQR